jgi:Ni/Co efflux regulator RcnB
MRFEWRRSSAPQAAAVGDLFRRSGISLQDGSLTSPTERKRCFLKHFRQAVAISTFAAFLSIGAVAQDHHDDPHHDDHRPDNNHYVRHDDWKKGYHMNSNDWNRGDRVDYHQYHLAPPPSGYEWRRVDGNYVMAAVATGVVASLVVASAAH